MDTWSSSRRTIPTITIFMLPPIVPSLNRVDTFKEAKQMQVYAIVCKKVFYFMMEHWKQHQRKHISTLPCRIHIEWHDSQRGCGGLKDFILCCVAIIRTVNPKTQCAQELKKQRLKLRQAIILKHKWGWLLS